MDKNTEKVCLSLSILLKAYSVNLTTISSIILLLAHPRCKRLQTAVSEIAEVAKRY